MKQQDTVKFDKFSRQSKNRNNKEVKYCVFLSLWLYLKFTLHKRQKTMG